MKKSKKTFGDPIDVEWIDAVSCAGWYSKKDLTQTPSECYCKSRGFFVCQDKTFLVIAHTINGDECIGVQYIPQGWILKRK
jgi:hypothetical protein